MRTVARDFFASVKAWEEAREEIRRVCLVAHAAVALKARREERRASAGELAKALGLLAAFRRAEVGTSKKLDGLLSDLILARSTDVRRVLRVGKIPA